MQLLISDANILIDMEEGGLTETMFALPHVFSIPDILFHEELEARHGHLIDLGLELGELGGDGVAYAMQLVANYRKTSRNDCFALALARNRHCPLLTGDRELTKAAQQEAVPAHGTIWLVETMIENQLLSIRQACTAYQQMQSAGRRLPWKKAEARLQNMEEEQ